MHHALKIFLLILLLIAAGCATSPPAKYYLLKYPSPKLGKQPRLQTADHVSLQVHVPDYLDRPHIMVREAEHRLALSDRNRWAEPLSRMITTFLSQYLASGPVPVQINPSGPTKDEMRISIQILRLDGKPGDRVNLEANWQIAPAGAGSGQAYFFSATAPASGQRMEDLVLAHEQVLHDLAEELKTALELNGFGLRPQVGSPAPTP
ncbi:MAG: membrane integrity-associated transporter subunit PqiC [Desulfovermiculus sp.]